MRKMNCRNVRREIEEIASGDLLSSSVRDHMKDCTQCATFREQRLKLREMLSSLGGVEAPGDFDFRLRARLANERGAGAGPFVMRTFFFGFRSAAAVALVLLVGSALLFVGLRTSQNNSSSANGTKPPAPAGEQSGPAPKIDESANLAPNTMATDVKVTAQSAQQKREIRAGSRPDQLASLQGGARTNRPLKTRELASTGARVLRPTDLIAASGSNAFPIGAPFQSLKVSLDDGRGASRTISLPSVSFGSQRILAQGSSPLLASARTDW